MDIAFQEKRRKLSLAILAAGPPEDTLACRQLVKLDCNRSVILANSERRHYSVPHADPQTCVQRL
jgi:hypothetical protein